MLKPPNSPISYQSYNISSSVEVPELFVLNILHTPSSNVDPYIVLNILFSNVVYKTSFGHVL